MKTIVYIHGAMSSPIAFQYIKEKLPEHNAVLIKYDSAGKLYEALAGILKDIKQQVNADQEIDIIAHSLGGLMALQVASCRHLYIGKVVTISAPFGGSESALVMRMLYPFTTFFKEISPTSAFVRDTKKLFTEGRMRSLVQQGKFLPIVTNTGKSTLMKIDNDLVVTVNSQTALPFDDYQSIDVNHFEVLQVPEVVSEIQRFLWN